MTDTIETQFFHDAVRPFLSENGPYSLRLQRDNDGVPALVLTHGNDTVDLDMLDVYQQCAYLIRQHEKMRILEKHQQWGLDVAPFNVMTFAEACKPQ